MAYIGNSPGNIQRGRRAVYEFTSTAGQTAFSGVDDNGLTLDLLDPVENDVYLNGSRLILNDDYTISGDTLTLTSASALNDIIVIVTQDDVANAGSYTKAESDSRYINYDGDIVNGDIQVVGNINLGDNNKINLGADSDLQIYHDGDDSYVTDQGAGNLVLQGTNLRLQNSAGTDYLYANNGAAVSIAYGGAYKLATTSTGIDVTGRVTSDGITSNDNTHIFTSPSYNIIDFISDNNDDGSNDDIIVNFKNGSAGTIKAELRWDESSDTFEISRADNRGDLVLASNGDVGIGTTNPSFGAGGFGLELAGAAGAGRPTIRIKDTVTSNALQLSATATAAILESRSSGMSLVLGTSGAEKFRIDDSSGYLVSQHQSQVRLVLGSVGNSNDNSSNWIRGNQSYLQYNSAASGHTWEIAGAEKMRIHSSGKVLINTQDPQEDPSMLRVLNSMSNLGGVYLGKVHNSTNVTTGAVLIHKLGQGQGCQFSGKFIVNSWTGNRHIDCHVTSYYTNDSVSVNSNFTNSGGVSQTTVRLCTVSYAGSSWLAFVKDGGGSGVSYLNAFISGNIDYNGGITEVSSGNYSITTTHYTF